MLTASYINTEYEYANLLYKLMQFKCHIKILKQMSGLIGDKKYSDAIMLFYTCNPSKYMRVRNVISNC